MRWLTICGLCLLAFTFAHAQDATPEVGEGWTIEQRCVGEPTAPPEGWAFEGTIFLQNSDGIHALRADFETPYYIAFADTHFITAGAISPDGSMYAVPSGHKEYGNMAADVYIVEEIRVYSTAPSNELLFTFSIHYSEYSDSEEVGVSNVVWLDNEQIVYYGTKNWGEMESSTGFFVLDLTTNEITSRIVETPIDPLLAISSPDETRAIRAEYDSSTGRAERTLYDVETGSIITVLDSTARHAYISWYPDSLFFIAHFQSEGAPTFIFDRNGNIVETLYPEGIYSVSWSSDGQQFVFVSNTNVYIADMQEQQIIDICLSIPYGTVWFISNTKIVFNDPSMREIVILNLSDWQPYIVAYHRSTIIGWGARD